MYRFWCELANKITVTPPTEPCEEEVIRTLHALNILEGFIQSIGFDRFAEITRSSTTSDEVQEKIFQEIENKGVGGMSSCFY
jgi:hypothetical protein